MASCDGKYAIYRVYEIDERTAKLRIADDLTDLATTVLGYFESLPHGVSANGVSIQPESLAFAEETVLDMPDVPEEE